MSIASCCCWVEGFFFHVVHSSNVFTFTFLYVRTRHIATDRNLRPWIVGWQIRVVSKAEVRHFALRFDVTCTLIYRRLDCKKIFSYVSRSDESLFLCTLCLVVTWVILRFRVLKCVVFWKYYQYNYFKKQHIAINSCIWYVASRLYRRKSSKFREFTVQQAFF